MKSKTLTNAARRAALLVLLVLMALPVYAGRFSGEWWPDGSGRWYYGIRDGDCKTTANCVENKGFTTSEKKARKAAKKAAKKANKEDKDSFMDDGRDNGACSEPGVRC